MTNLRSALLLVSLCACARTPASEPAAATAASSGAEPVAEPVATGGPIAFTPSPDVGAAPAGAITGQLFGQDATVEVSFTQVGESWGLQFDSAPGTGYATGAVSLDGNVAAGALLRSTSASRPSFLCDPTGANRNDSEVAYAIEVTSAELRPCPADATDWVEIGTVTGRIVVLARDRAGDAADSYLAGTFTDVTVSCMSGG